MDNLKIAVIKKNAVQIEKLLLQVLLEGSLAAGFSGSYALITFDTVLGAIAQGNKKYREWNVPDKDKSHIEFNKNSLIRVRLDYLDDAWYLTGIRYVGLDDRPYCFDVGILPASLPTVLK